ncbi:MAG TPA: redoxin family protein [Pyrinomonadaceae bacterium]|nr:redoxin family protein [Pyrinomonadaceae bacterium]
MRKLIYLTVLTILLGCSISEIRAENLRIGAKFPIDKLTSEKKPANNTIVVFMPSLTYDCPYASMLTRSFYYYFDRQMAFEGLKKAPTTRIFLVVKDRMDLLKSAQNLFGTMSIIYDEKGELFSAFNVKQPANKNADSTVVLLDSKETVVHVDANYRAQGEHLKPLENKLKQLNGIYEKVPAPSAQKNLKVGDKAPDFRLNEKQVLSDLRGKIVLISFYPAAFSGTLPSPAYFYSSLTSKKPVQLEDSLTPKSSKSELWTLVAVDGSSDPAFNAEENPMSCFRQISSLDIPPKSAKSKSEIKRIAISSSTKSILNKWREVLGTNNIEYTNDPDYSVSSKYFSYNPNGYNNRVSVIIDQKGKIAYIDRDFESRDESVLNAKIYELQRK